MAECEKLIPELQKLFIDDNVWSIGIGLKQQNKKYLGNDVWAIKFMVREKISEKELSPDKLLPKKYKNQLTDVEEISPDKITPVAASAGNCISAEGLGTGTMAAVGRNNLGIRKLITVAHFFPNCNVVPGTKIFSNNEHIATITEQSSNPQANDALKALIVAPLKVSCKLWDGSSFGNTIVDPFPGLAIKRQGCNTFSTGTVIIIIFNNSWCGGTQTTFVLSNASVVPGDSGSPVVTDDDKNNFVGMSVGQVENTSLSVSLKASDILNGLSLTLCQ